MLRTGIRVRLARLLTARTDINTALRTLLRPVALLGTLSLRIAVTVLLVNALIGTVLVKTLSLRLVLRL
ncbi:MAG: hypothetical protein LUH17_00970, partial [Acidaminococcaceae bacterium]|nr:hypothetical protein [Acidaminococcaceae bacterium]